MRKRIYERLFQKKSSVPLEDWEVMILEGLEVVRNQFIGNNDENMDVMEKMIGAGLK